MLFVALYRTVVTAFVNECASRETSITPSLNPNIRNHELHTNPRCEDGKTNEKHQIGYPTMLQIHEKELEMQRIIEQPLIECR